MISGKRSKTPVIIIVVAIFVLALLLRGMAFLKFKDNVTLTGDARNYWLMSQQLADTGIYGYWYEGNPYGGFPGVPNARVMPGYPVFLAILYKIIGNPYLQITAARILQVLAGSLSAILAFLAIRKIFKKDLPAILTALFVAIYPTYILSCITILTESLGLFTMLLYFWISAIAFESGKKSHNILAGAAFGVHILIRPTLFPMFIIPFIYLLISALKKRSVKDTVIGQGTDRPLTVRKVGMYFLMQLIGFVALMAPWWIRNLLTLGSFILTAKGDGNALLAGTYPYWQNYMGDVPDRIRGVNDAQRAFGIERILTGLKTDFWLYLKWFTLGKIEYLFINASSHTAMQPYMVGLLKSTLADIHILLHRIILVSGVVGMIWKSVKSIRGFYFYLYGLILLGLQLLFIPDPRYAYLIMFFFIVGSAHFFSNLWELIKTPPSERKKLAKRPQ